MYRTLVTVLLVLSAGAELFGTATVAVNYARGRRVAKGILVVLEDDERASESMPVAQRSIGLADPVLANLEVRAAQAKLRDLRNDVASQLSGRWWLTAGLVSYGVGAVLGLAAGLVALNH
jgi:hypothetical protein